MLFCLVRVQYFMKNGKKRDKRTSAVEKTNNKKGRSLINNLFLYGFSVGGVQSYFINVLMTVVV